MVYEPTVPTIIFISLFLIAYLVFLVRKAVGALIDLYDLVMLSAVAIFPALFVFFPKLMVRFTGLFGVKFPFLVLFGGLLLIVFLYLYRLIIKINDLTNRNSRLTQEVSLLIAKNKEMGHG